MYYRMGGIDIELTGDNDYFENRCRDFVIDNIQKKEPDLKVVYEIVDNITIPQGEEIINDSSVVLKKNKPEQGFYLYVPSKSDHDINFLMDVNSQWNYVHMKYKKNSMKLMQDNGIPSAEWNEYHSFMSVGIAYRNILIKKNGLSIHSSGISIDNTGIIFSAPSGTGKSTHVRMWKELFGERVKIINDDRPAIRYVENNPLLCGIPWSGSSSFFENVMVPLKGIVILEQAPNNCIEKLKYSESIQLLMPRCFLPYYDEVLIDEALNTLEKLIHDIPVYHLKCLPNHEAVKLVYKCIM